MKKLNLTLATSHYDHMADLLLGRVPVQGIDLTYLDLQVEEIFFRMVTYRDFDVSEISMAKLLTLLFEITGLFDMKTRPELLLLQKTMVVVEGVARSLDPKLDMWSVSEPVVREWMERHLGPAGRIEDARCRFAFRACWRW